VPIESPRAVYAPLLGRSTIMQDVYKSLAWLSTQIVPVLIESEPGSGKGQVARALHDMAGYYEAPYVEMNCAQIPQEGHGAHLFHESDGALFQARGGTLFINNIEMLDSAAQLEFVRGLEAQSKRRQDIPAIAQYFCEQANESFKTSRNLSLSALSALQDYEWPGNVKELEFITRRLVMAGTAPQIEAHHVYHELGMQKRDDNKVMANSLNEAADLHIRNYFDALGDDEPPTGLYERIIEEVERPLIIRTLHLTKGNQIKAAQILGLNRNTLRKKIDLLTISKDRSDYKEQS